MLVSKAISQRWITPIQVNVPPDFSRLCDLAGVQRSEAAAIKHAQVRNFIALLDDLPARILARSLQIPVKGTLGILLEAVGKQIIDKKAAREKLEELSDFMYLSSDLYRRVRREIEEA